MVIQWAVIVERIWIHVGARFPYISSHKYLCLELGKWGLIAQSVRKKLGHFQWQYNLPKLGNIRLRESFPHIGLPTKAMERGWRRFDIFGISDYIWWYAGNKKQVPFCGKATLASP